MNVSLRMISRYGVLLFLLGAGLYQLSSGVGIYLKAWLAQELIEHAWAQPEQNAKPWPWADTHPVAKLIVPRLGIEQYVLSGDSGRVLAFGPGFNEASTLPGENGISMISAHRDTHFEFLKHLQEGDQIVIQTPKRKITYEVFEQGVVDQHSYHPEVDVDGVLLMLVTCYPFDALEAGGDLRFIVIAEMI